MPAKGQHKQFCIHGHDTWITGRNAGNSCNVCMTEYMQEVKEGRGVAHKKQFCDVGHDTFVTGRYINGECKVCKNEYVLEHKEQRNACTKEWNEANKDKIRIQKQEYRLKNGIRMHEAQTAYNRSISGKFNTLRSRAKRNGIFFDLTLEQYASIISQGCYYCGINLLILTNGSVDRINNDKTIGYRIDNVLPCCGPCNFVKNDFHTVEETKVMVIARNLFRKKFLLKD